MENEENKLDEVELVYAFKRKRNELSNSRKMEVIQLAQEGRSQRQLAAEFGVSKSQVQSILQRKDDIIYRQLNEGDDSTPPRKKTNFDDVNERVLNWYMQAKARGIAVTGAYLQQKAREIGRELGKDYFRGSNGWLEAFKKRHKELFTEGKVPPLVTQVKEAKSETSDTVSDKVVSAISPHTNVQGITEGFEPRDVYFACETALYFRSVPDLAFSSSEVKVTDRVTVLLCTNMLGHKEPVFVVGKRTSQPIFRNIDVRSLPVDWSTNYRALMTGDLFLSWLRGLNDRVRKEDRKILLFLEGTPIHADVKLSNVVLRFFRENETNKVHVLHTGLTQEFKMQYRVRLLHYLMAAGVLFNTQHPPNPDHVDRITLINVVFWISSSWDSVKFKIIQDSFSAAGFPSSPMQSLTYPGQFDVGRTSQFHTDSEFSSPVTSPIQRCVDFHSTKDDYLQAFLAVCNVPEEIDIHELAVRYLTEDDALPTYDTSDNNWDGQYMQNKRLEITKTESSEGYENRKETVHLCLLNSFEEVDETFRQLQDYAQENNFVACLNHIAKARDSLVEDIWRRQYPQTRLNAREHSQEHSWRKEHQSQSIAMDYALERASFALSPPCESKVSPTYENVDTSLHGSSNDVR